MFRAGIDNPKFTASTHFLDDCTTCHAGGDSTTADRDAAHAGMQKIPGGNTCQGCHPTAVSLAATSLHVKPSGFATVLAGRGFVFGTGTTSGDRFTKQCTKCHIHNAETPEQQACGHCHVSVPNSAGGGLVAGHRMNRTPDTVNNCTACHGSRVKDEYFGSNQALFTRNLDTAKGSIVPSDYPFRGTTLQADVHKATMGCDACHYKSEMHGVGGGAGIDRYGVTGTPECRSCHAPADAGAAASFHSSTHLAAMSCHVCHSQPYKQCFGCHTEETASGTAYFSTNATDPTRDERRVPAAWSGTVTYATGAYVTYGSVEYRSLLASNLNKQPDLNPTWWTVASAPLPAGDALITFRIGNNPKFGTEPGAPKYALLRHVPVDPKVFEYSGLTGAPPAVPGLIPSMSALPTWKYATPHNIVRATKITSDPDGAGPLTACGNCHSARYAQFWLTDSVTDTFGFVPDPATDPFYQFEVDANANVEQLTRPTTTEYQ